MTQPPIAPPPFDQSPEAVLAATHKVLATTRQLHNSIVKNVTVENASFSNTILPLIQDEDQLLYERQLIEFHGSVSPDVSLRKASREASSLFSQLDAEIAQNEDLYKLIAAVKDGSGYNEIDPEYQRWITETLQRSQNKGLALGSSDRQRLQELEQSLQRLSNEYLDAIGSTGKHFAYSRAELEGVSADVLDALPVEDDQVQLTLHDQQYRDLIREVSSGETRKRMYSDYCSRVDGNVARMQEGMVLRTERAALLGHDTHAACEMVEYMEKSPEKTVAFLEDLLKQLTPVRNARRAKMREAKKADLLARGEVDDGKFYPYDQRYYSRMVDQGEDGAKEDAAVTFQLKETVENMLHTFERCFGLQFVELTKENCAQYSFDLSKHIWHEDVRLFAVWNDVDGRKQQKEFIGYLYMDLYRRAGKAPGFADLPVRPAFDKPDGTRAYTVTALRCDFEKPPEGQPCMLGHSLVVVLFHELGHGLHDLVAKTKCARFHGASTPGDFNEAPSQMLEQWCYVPSVLEVLGSAKSGGGSSDWAQTLVRDRQDNAVHMALVLIQRSLFQLAVSMVRSPEKAQKLDTTELYYDILARASDLDVPEDKPPIQGTETDMFSNGSMHVYLAAQVYMMDIFQHAFKTDPMNRETGLRYREMVIGKGNSEDTMEMLTKYLGRPPNPNAFYEGLGVGA